MISHNQTNLPRSFEKRAEITFALKFGQWVTIAQYASRTHGVDPRYFMLRHNASGLARRVSANVYFNMVRYYANRRTRA